MCNLAILLKTMHRDSCLRIRHLIPCSALESTLPVCVSSYSTKIALSLSIAISLFQLYYVHHQNCSTLLPN